MMKKSNLCIAIITLLPFTVYAQNASTAKNVDKNSKNILQISSENSNAKVIYDVNFNTLNKLPADFRIPNNNVGGVEIAQGKLNIDGRKSDTKTTSVLLPKALENSQNYRVDVDFTLDQPINTSRWGGLIYKVSHNEKNQLEQYYQFTIRSHATAQNGTEFGVRQKKGQWNVQLTKAFSENIDPKKTYRASVIVSNNRVQHYLNNILMQDAELSNNQPKGGIGLSVAGLVMKVSHIKVTEQTTALAKITPKIVAVQEVKTNVALAPTLIQKMDDSSEFSSNASQVFFRLNDDLDLVGSNGKAQSSLIEYLTDKQKHTIPVLEIQNIETIQALEKLSKSHDISDMTLLSNNEALLKEAHQRIPMVRTALDLRGYTALGNNPKDLQSIVQKINQSFARIALIPHQYINKNNVSFLQKLLITVWADSPAQTEKEAAFILTSGVNGILAKHTDVFNNTLKRFPKNTLLRKPFVIGHRGVPALEDENTVESANHAVSLGADIIENDIYITKDNHLVVMHDDTVDRTTNGHGKIEDMTLAQVEQLRTTMRNRKIPTLSEYFLNLKPMNNVVLMVELKSANPKLVPALKAEVDKYNFADHLVTTSFHREQTNRIKSYLPGISTGMLVGNLPNTGNVLNNAYQIMQDTQRYSSTYNPAYRADLPTLMEITKHRGISYWPWALDDKAFKKLYVAGTYGITTNSAQLYSNYIVGIKAPSSVVVKSGQKFYISADLKTQDGRVIKAKANQYIVLSGSPAYTATAKNDALTFKSKGIAYVLAGYQYHIDNQYFYTIFSSPIQVNIK